MSNYMYVLVLLQGLSQSHNLVSYDMASEYHWCLQILYFAVFCDQAWHVLHPYDKSHELCKKLDGK